MADSTNNPRISKFEELRQSSTMIRVEENVKEHYKGATKSVKLLRADLLAAHSLLSEAGCAGQFAAWLRLMEIPKATAYYILGKKKNGRFAKEGTGKWGAAPRKPLTAKQRKAARSRTYRAFRQRIVNTLKELPIGRARNFLGGLFKQAFKKANPDASLFKAFSLREALGPKANAWKQVGPKAAKLNLGNGDGVLFRVGASRSARALASLWLSASFHAFSRESTRIVSEV